MYYEDKNLGFSFELPDGWRGDETIRPLTFFGPSGHLGRANELIQIKIGTIRPGFLDPDSREEFLAEPGAVARRGRLGVETNVVVLERTDNSEISAVRDGVHYIIGHANDTVTLQAISRLKESFRFPLPDRVAEVVLRSADPTKKTLGKALEAGSPEEARHILTGAGMPHSIDHPGYTINQIGNSGGRRLKVLKTRYLHESPNTKLCGLSAGQKEKQSQGNNWAALIRESLTNKEVCLIDQAIEVLQSKIIRSRIPKRQSFLQCLLQQKAPDVLINSRILALLEAWQRMDFEYVVRETPSLVDQLHAVGRKEASLTLMLLHDEILIQRAEGYQSAPVSLQLQVFQTGLDACAGCIRIARQLGDYYSTAGYLMRLGNGLYSSRRLSESIKAFKEALSIWQAIAETQPHQYMPEVAQTLAHLGTVWGESQELIKAEAAFKESLAIFRELNCIYPQQYSLKLARFLNDFGALHLKAGRPATALELVEESLSLYRDLMTGEPPNTEPAPIISEPPPLEWDVARVLCNKGHALCDLNRNLREAQAAFEEALSIQEGQVFQVPLLRLQVARSRTGLGKALFRLGCSVSGDKLQESMRLFEAARKELEEALSLQRQYIPEKIPEHIPDVITTLLNLGILLGRQREAELAKQLLEEAIDISKRNEMWMLLAQVFRARSAIEVWSSGDPLAGVLFDVQSVRVLEKGLAGLGGFERVNRAVFKGEFEISYAGCIAHYAQQGNAERVFHLIESLNRVDRLSEPSLEPSVTVDYVDLGRAKELMTQHGIAYLAIQVVPGGMVFFTLLPSGEVEVYSIGKGWRAEFFRLFTQINESIKKISQQQDWESFGNEAGNLTADLADLGKRLFDRLPKAVQSLLTSEVKYVFISPSGDLQNIPFEFLRLPTGEWLGLRQLLPRVHSFAELQSVLLRQPDLEARLSVVVGDPLNDLNAVRETTISLAKQLKIQGFNLIPNGDTITGDAATAQKFLDALNSKIVFGLYSGHGGFDTDGTFLALAQGVKVRPFELGHLRLTNAPIIFYDCCQAGIATYYTGGDHRGFGYFTIAIGAACCLLSNRFVMEEISAFVAELFCSKLLKEGNTTGMALLETRRQVAKKYPSPLCWAFPILFGNPNARLL